MANIVNRVRKWSPSAKTVAKGKVHCPCCGQERYVGQPCPRCCSGPPEIYTNRTDFPQRWLGYDSMGNVVEHVVIQPNCVFSPATNGLRWTIAHYGVHGDACPTCGQKLDGIFVCRQCDSLGLFEMELHILTSCNGQPNREQVELCQSWGWPRPMRIDLRHLKKGKLIVMFRSEPDGPAIFALKQVGNLHQERRTSKRIRYYVVTIKLDLLREHGYPGAAYCDQAHYMPF